MLSSWSQWFFVVVRGSWACSFPVEAARTSETFDFDDGTIRGWDILGNYTTVNTGNSVHISAALPFMVLGTASHRRRSSTSRRVRGA